MFDHLAMACKHYDYTVVIAILHCPHRTILVLKLSLVVEIQALLYYPATDGLHEYTYHVPGCEYINMTISIPGIAR